MKTINTYFTSETQLYEFIELHNIEDSSQLLIQIFTAKNDFTFLSELTRFFSNHLPLSTLIGATTDGEIKDGYISTNKTVISFSIFESTRLKTYISDSFENYYRAGENLASTIIDNETKVLITFIDGLSGNGEEFLNGIDSINKDVIISGGLAGDNATFTKTYVFTKEKILTNGVVGVSLSSPSLNVFTDYSFSWQPIGKTLHITNAKENRVYTIDDKTAVDTYNYYLGNDIGSKLPHVGIEFPLIIERDGFNIARAVIAKEKDGSLIFAGNLNNGDKVRFGYGDSDIILGETQKHIDILSNVPIESIFIYSCMARRRFIPLEIECETLVYNQIATTSGFFTYGEFFSTANTKQLLNQSMSVLALSESNTIENNKIIFQNTNTKSTTIQALSHLISVSTKELDIAQKELKILAATDPLTHLYNRRYFMDAATNIFNIAIRYKKPLSIIMLDIDKFKNVNDTYGHQIGDCVLVELANLLQESRRNSDFICRYGGEEFVILLPETDQKNAILLAEDIRKKIEVCEIVLKKDLIIKFTVSLGVSEIDYAKDTTIEQVLSRVDKALYKAKDAGRNRAVFTGLVYREYTEDTQMKKDGFID